MDGAFDIFQRALFDPVEFKPELRTVRRSGKHLRDRMAEIATDAFFADRLGEFGIVIEIGDRGVAIQAGGAGAFALFKINLHVRRPENRIAGRIGVQTPLPIVVQLLMALAALLAGGETFFT